MKVQKAPKIRITYSDKVLSPEEERKTIAKLLSILLSEPIEKIKTAQGGEYV